MSERTATALEDVLARVLRWGVVASVALIAAGTAAAFAGDAAWGLHPGTAAPPPDLPGILAGLAEMRGDAWIRLGLLVLIATPVLRVAVSAAAFAARRERLWTAIALFVLAVLVASSFVGAAAAIDAMVADLGEAR